MSSPGNTLQLIPVGLSSAPTESSLSSCSAVNNGSKGGRVGGKGGREGGREREGGEKGRVKKRHDMDKEKITPTHHFD